MKKQLILAFALVGATVTFTACHDDDDEPSNYVMDYSSPKVNTTGAFDMIANQTGVSTFTLSDAQGYSDVYFFSNDGNMVKQLVDQNLVLSGAALDSISSTYYGGFFPTWFEANDEEQWFTPYDQTYKSGASALLCNPGLICRAFFSKHIQADLEAALSALLLDEIEGLYVNTTSIYEILEEGEGNAELRSELGIADLPANSRIEFVVYGYVDSFKFDSFKTFFGALKQGATQVANGGMEGTPLTLAETDKDGKTTVKVKSWTYVDLGNIDDCYLFEAYIRIVDSTTGKTIDTYDMNSSYLNYVLVDDITYGSKF